MSEILTDEQDILDAADERFVALGEISGEKIINGRSDKVQKEEAWKILQLKEAYENSSELSDDDRESVLFSLRELSQAFVVPAVSGANKLAGIL